MNAADELRVRNSYKLKGRFKNLGGFLWQADLPHQFEEDADDVGYPEGSAWLLTENGRPLGPMHSDASEIATNGQGRARHWKSWLQFSTSDNSDPNANGRQYHLRWTGGGDKKWLAALEAPALADPAPFGPRSDVTRCSGVFAIIGWRFAGGELFAALAGAHPSIFDGGELHWLTRQPIGPLSQCAACGRECRYWTREQRFGISIETLYHDVSRLFGRPFIVDGSRNPSWFRRVEPLYPDVPTTRILLTKHPVRQLAREFEEQASLVTFADCATVLRELRQFYEAVAVRGERPFAAKYYDGTRLPADLHVRYEDLVHDPATGLAPALARFGLEYDPRIAAWQELEHHPIAGTARSSAAGRTRRRSGLFLDNSYSHFLDLDIISRIMGHSDAQWLCERFGYDF
jgi:hypothetical protein